MNRRMLVWSFTTWLTRCGLEYGDTTTTGTRNPYRSNTPGTSPGSSIGAIPSGTGARRCRARAA